MTISAPPLHENGLDAFRRDSLRQGSVVYLWMLVVAALIAWSTYVAFVDSGLSAIGPGLVVYYSIATLHLIHRLHGSHRRAALLAPDLVFVGMYTLFHLAYVTLFVMGVVGYRADIFYYEASVPKALFVINLGLLSFLIGHEGLGLRRRRHLDLVEVESPNPAWARSGTALVAGGLGLHIYVLVSLGFDFLTAHGYVGIQNISDYSYGAGVLLTLSSALGSMGLVVHLAASALGRRRLFTSNVALTAVTALVFLHVLEGNRSPILVLTLPMIAIRHFFIRAFRLRTIFVLVAAGMGLFTVIGVARSTIFAPSLMYAEYRAQANRGEVGWERGLVEMGGSFLPVNIVCHDVPSRTPYWRGASWFAAGLHVVPFLQGFAYRSGWIREGPSAWVTHTYFGPEASGRAFTVSAEGYLNFGYPGVIVELLSVGVFLRWLTMRFSQAPSAFWAFVLAAGFPQLILLVRNHLSPAIGNLALIAALAVVLQVIIRNSVWQRALLGRSDKGVRVRG